VPKTLAPEVKLAAAPQEEAKSLQGAGQVPDVGILRAADNPTPPGSSPNQDEEKLFNAGSAQPGQDPLLPSPPRTDSLPPRPAFVEKAEASAPTDSQKNILESLKQAQADKPGQVAPATPSQTGSTALKLDNSPWSFQMEITQGRTLLRARLHKSAEFKVLCDRVEMKAPDGSMQAVGKVTLSGPGVTATCQRLTLPLTGAQMLLEGQAEVKIYEAPQATERETTPVDSRPAWALRGEYLSLRPSGLIRWQNPSGPTASSDAADVQTVRPSGGGGPDARGTEPGPASTGQAFPQLSEPLRGVAPAGSGLPALSSSPTANSPGTFPLLPGSPGRP
jgi:hypothetical protein